jgi:hypothetical protein
MGVRRRRARCLKLGRSGRWDGLFHRSFELRVELRSQTVARSIEFCLGARYAVQHGVHLLRAQENEPEQEQEEDFGAKSHG